MRRAVPRVSSGCLSPIRLGLNALGPTTLSKVCGHLSSVFEVSEPVLTHLDYTPDFAIVQASNFTTLFVLSRTRNVADSVVNVGYASLIPQLYQCVMLTSRRLG